jgi:hypothetical protein
LASGQGATPAGVRERVGRALFSRPLHEHHISDDATEKFKSEEEFKMHRSYVAGLTAGSIGLMSVTQAVGQQTCTPAFAFKQVRLSEMRPPTLNRKWTAILSVDASRCATNSGLFEIVFSRSKENAPDIDFKEQLVWQSNPVEVSMTVSADEAMTGYRIDNVAACPCAK